MTYQDSRPRHARGVASRVIEGEAVLIVPARREAHVLNESGSAAWAMMDGSRTSDELASELARRYSLDPARAGRDVDSFLDNLRERGAVETNDAVARPSAVESPPPAPSAYSPPAVAESHTLEVVAALCNSQRTGGSGGSPKPKPGKCRADPGACKKLFE